jgi:cellobionic acid phosphorylase
MSTFMGSKKGQVQKRQSTESQSVVLNSPTARANACGFLWNKSMMLSMNCQGYANAQFMQPEPSKYAFSPSLEAKTFMQPEHPYFAHHPGRFFYIKNEQSGAFFSIPFAPCKTKLDNFTFEVFPHKIVWRIKHAGLEIELNLKLAQEQPLEQWCISLKRIDSRADDTWSVYAYFPFGYMSWMNQSAEFNYDSQALVATYVTPYQKLEEYPRLKNTAQKTFLCADREPDSWCANQSGFEGCGGLSAPEALKSDVLNEQTAIYELPCAALQHRIILDDEKPQNINYLFGPAHNNDEIAALKREYFTDKMREQSAPSTFGPLQVATPDAEFDQFINLWLPRQVEYHCDVNRLTTDPQTRNYIQDNIGSCFMQPERAKACLTRCLSQQHVNGDMPDGILIHSDAELKYINQIPHSDHCVWLPILLEVYLNQSNDFAFMQENIAYGDSDIAHTVFEHIENGLDYLLSRRDTRGLSYIDQGDWCDPMNMVGAKGKGVSVWLTMASAYALRIWLRIIDKYVEHSGQRALSQTKWQRLLTELNTRINRHCWDQNWYARGITDANELFGISRDDEGRMYLNPQSWALLSGCADEKQQKRMLKSVAQHLQTPFGNMILAPSYTKMDERIGRLTQKHMGCAENGSVYNHAFVFWIFAMYESGNQHRGFLCVKEMLNAMTSQQSGQMPLYVPNYFRGAYFQVPEAAGKSSHLFNTGTAAWLYRIVIEKIFGLQGGGSMLVIAPNLPAEWPRVNVDYAFRGARFTISIEQYDVPCVRLSLDGVEQSSNSIDNIEAGKTYTVNIQVPFVKSQSKPKAIIITGVSGSGKSTVAQQIAKRFDAIFLEGDDLHSSVAKSKMSRGIALNDDDRSPWIARLIQNMKQKLAHGHDVVLSFSGLKYKHRRMLRDALEEHCSDLSMIFLALSQQDVQSRQATRKGHFFHPSLVASQFAALQVPMPSELDIVDASLDLNSIVSNCLQCINKTQ